MSMATLQLSKEDAWEAFKQVLIPQCQNITTHAGLRVPFFVTPESIAEAASLPLDPSDVWIATYAKAGTTWTQNIVKLIRSKGEKDGVLLMKSVPWAEAKHPSTLFKVNLSTLPKPRAFKSHMPYELMPCGKPNTTPCKYIYVARNPKDVATSYFFHHIRMTVRKDATTLDWDLFFRNFIYGNVDFGDFFDHVLSWWPHRNDDNVLFLMFEDMKKDPRTAITRIATFIGADISDEVIDKVVAETSFDSMKKDETANYSALNFIAKPGSTAFMRKGEVGDWRNHLTPEQSAEIDQLCQEKLKDTGLLFDFGE